MNDLNSLRRSHHYNQRSHCNIYMLQYNVHRRRTWFHSIDMWLSYYHRYLRLKKKSGSKTNSYWISMKNVHSNFRIFSNKIYEHKHINNNQQQTNTQTQTLMWISWEQKMVEYGTIREYLLTINQKAKTGMSSQRQLYSRAKMFLLKK